MAFSALAFCGGLLLAMLLARAGELTVFIVLTASAAGAAMVWRSRENAVEPHRAEPPLPVPPLPPVTKAPTPAAIRPPVRPPGPDLEVATIVHDESALTRMLDRKPPCWRYAAFVSVMVQRRRAVEARLRDARMGFAESGGEIVVDELAAAEFFTDRLAELGDVVEQIDAFLLSTAFQEVFGADETSADPDGIRQAAGRLMDYHDRALALCERCRAVNVPPHCRDLQRDFGLLTALPLESFGAFIADFTERVEEAADVARYATGDIQLAPVCLSLVDDGDLLGRVSRRLQQIGGRA